MFDDQITVYFQQLILLYADDTVIFGTDPETFQHNLNCFYEYSANWKLDINFRKSKIMVFDIRNTNQSEFKLGENAISTCDEFKYIGVAFFKRTAVFTRLLGTILIMRKKHFTFYTKR